MSEAVRSHNLPVGCSKCLMAAAPDFALSVAFIVTWVAPNTFGQQAVRHFMNLMLFEFLVVHATGVLGAIGLSERMAMAIELSRLNVEQRTGGPFGAAVFERGTASRRALTRNEPDR